MRSLREVVSAILSAQGALVAPVEPDAVEVVAPEALQRALALPEWFRLGFGADLPDRAQRVTLESEWVERLGAVLGDKGRFVECALAEDDAHRFPTDAERMLAHAVALENATFRPGGTAKVRTRYLLLTLRFTAASDEKREQLIDLCVNESNGACVDSLAGPLRDRLDQADGAGPATAAEATGPPAWNGAQVAQFVRKALDTRIRTRLRPFVGAMERRMRRDLERIHAYHGDLYRQAERRLQAKANKGESEDALAGERLRLKAIEREYHAKALDLRRKYAMSVKVDLLQALRVVMPALRLHLQLLRRKGMRPFHLDWNPISRKLDTLSCEGCAGDAPARLLCDERLHLLCPACYALCPSCGKPWCRACHASGCPRCGTG